MPHEVPPLAKLIARIVPAIFGVIGVSVLIFLWSMPFDDWRSPPLFFRVFGSLIALVFIVVGFGGAILGGKIKSLGPRRSSRRRQRSDLQLGYQCSNCGATLGDGAEVSPSGDVKCGFCDRWFNIHSQG